MGFYFMPGGVPVATVALDGALNAGIIAAQIIGTSDEAVAQKLISYKENLKQKVLESVAEIETKGYK
jgi:5-(carboxyamino)imidazole ribonucleotide mutase